MNHRHPLPLFLREAQHLQRLGAWRLCGQALLTGLIAGGIIGLFRRLYDTFRLYASYWLQLYAADTPWAWAYILGGLALLAMIAHLLLRQEPLISGSGIPQVELIAAGKLPPMRWARVLWCKFVATLAALSAGLSVGREGPCIMMGATVGAGVGYMWHDRCRANRPRYLVGGGVAGMTAAFGAPVAGMFFAFEEMKTPLTLPMLLFTSLSALSAWFMVDVVLDFGLVFPFARLPGLHWSQYWLPLLAGMSCGLLGAVYNAGMIRLLLWQDRARWLPGPVRIVFPFVCCGVLLLVWPEITGNMGLTTLQLEHLRLPALALALLLAGKIAFSCVSFASGVSGGCMTGDGAPAAAVPRGGRPGTTIASGAPGASGTSATSGVPLPPRSSPQGGEQPAAVWVWRQAWQQAGARRRMDSCLPAAVGVYQLYSMACSMSRTSKLPSP